MNAALEGGELSAARPGHTLLPRKDPVPIVQEAGWAPGPVWTGGKSRPTGIRSPDRSTRSQSLYRLNYPTHDRNEYLGYLHGGKGGRYIGLITLPPSCADCLEIVGASTSWSNSGPIQADNGIEEVHICSLISVTVRQRMWLGWYCHGVQLASVG